MNLTFEPFTPGQTGLLAEWLSQETWPYHTRERPTSEQVREQVEEGDYTGPENRTFWVVLDGEKVGLLRLEYLSEPSPTTDFRVREAYRGRGVGEQMVRWAAEYVFTTWPEKPRLEGQTRADNAAMRRVFERCGWVMEAHYRESWPSGGGYVDSVGYAILNRNWASGEVTPVDRDSV